MEVLEGRALYDTIMARYSRDQTGWSFVVSPSSSHGFFDALVSNREESWHLKFDTLYKPNPLVLGASVGGLRGPANPSADRFSFGFREMEASWLDVLRQQDEGAAIPEGLIARLASMKPVVPRSGRAYAQGPFKLSETGSVAREIGLASVDERLSSEMIRLMRNRYPGYG